MRTHVGAALVAACLLPAAAAAQEKPKTFVEARGNVVPVPLPPGGPAPRMADGKVDLSGVWFAGPTGKANAWSVVPDAPLAQDAVPFQPWADAKIKSMSRTERELGNPGVTCAPVGVPGMFTINPYPHQIVTTPGLFVHLIESDNRWRVVHTDGRPHKSKDELEPLYNGDETARWEGDTLVIDSISIDEQTWIQGNGWFHSDALHVIERLRRPSLNYLEYQFTIEDPKVLTRPWTSAWRTYSLGKEDLTENFCTRNENVDQLRKLNEVEAGTRR
ncbi:MAG: hypothetical protein HY824_13935 [Acidobacteria bacterium]|nr:hypothetical protein [Acidobacteriota bacterium]